MQHYSEKYKELHTFNSLLFFEMILGRKEKMYARLL